MTHPNTRQPIRLRANLTTTKRPMITRMQKSMMRQKRRQITLLCTKSNQSQQRLQMCPLRLQTWSEMRACKQAALWLRCSHTKLRRFWRKGAKTRKVPKRLQAGRTLAQVFAHEAEEVLAQRSKDEEGAKALEKLAASLRLNATKLVQDAPGKVEQAAMDAADSAAKRTLGQAKSLEAQAKKAEEEAAEERNEALSAMTS